MVSRSAGRDRARYFRHDALPVAAARPLIALQSIKTHSMGMHMHVRRLVAGGGVSLINIAIHALVMTGTDIVVRMVDRRHFRRAAENLDAHVRYPRAR
jgi:hypothetical protein